MPQTFQVLRCFQCLVFQVHPTKKANKWKCKMCGEKQSTERFYGLGTGKECRLQVQKLNGIQGDIHNSKSKLEDSDESSNSDEEETVFDNNDQNETVVKEINKRSKWTDYVDIAEENDQQNMYLKETEVVLELPKKKPRKSQHVDTCTSLLSSDNICAPATVIIDNNSSKDKTVQSKPFKKSVINLLHSDVLSPATTENYEKIDPSTSTKSKWAQYVEESDELENEDAAINEQTPNIFSLFDDDNLDTVLEF